MAATMVETAVHHLPPTDSFHSILVCVGSISISIDDARIKDVCMQCWCLMPAEHPGQCLRRPRATVPGIMLEGSPG
jgi:hypothetical protein